MLNCQDCNSAFHMECLSPVYKFSIPQNITPEKLAKVKELKNISDGLGVSLSQLSIAWCLKNPHVSTVILGASKVSQLEENIKSPEILPLLTNEIMEKIDQIMGNKPVLPEY